MRRMNRCVLLILLGGSIGAVMNGCIVRRIAGPQLTGTCDGACSHYVECKPGHREADRTRCVAECPDVYSDRDSLMAFESLQCQDAVEYVDGASTRAAVHR
jgi:hypothetical protein